MQIFVATGKSQMEEMRRRARSHFGDRYKSLVATYKSLVSQQFKRHQCRKSLEECARELIGLINSPSVSTRLKNEAAKPHMRALIYSAALDLHDEGFDR